MLGKLLAFTQLEIFTMIIWIIIMIWFRQIDQWKRAVMNI